MAKGSAPPPSPPPPRPYITLQGTLERITYVNEENNYVVARLEIPGRRDLLTIVGNLVSVNPGETLRLQGEWVTHRRYGEQFRVDRYETIRPATAAAIEKYLGSGLIKGIGPVFARRLVEAFGPDTLRVIEEEARRLLEVGGIGKIRLARITAAWEEQREIRQVMLFLQGHGVSSAYAVKIYKAYRQEAIRVVSENPYRLAQDVYGIGFKTADRIATNLGIPRDSPLRAQAGIAHVLGELADEGHVFYPVEPLLDQCVKELEIPPEILDPALEELQRADRVAVEAIPQVGGLAAYLRPLHVAEVHLARRLADVARAPRIQYPIDIERALRWVEEQNGVVLAPAQQLAVRRAIEEKLLVITGGPGTGKTTILRCIIQILDKKRLRILLAAPTGRAAKRMAEATGRGAKTIHRLLEWSPQEGAFKRNPDRPLEADLVIVDEASMIDLLLMNSLLRAVPLQSTLILVGDVDQLPSVGPGNVLRDIIASGTAEVITLTEVFRQAEESAIVVNAHRINRGEFPRWPDGEEAGGDFHFVARAEPEEVQRTILELVGERLPRSLGLQPLDDIQVITPMHRGPIGAAQLNEALQAALNPVRADGPEIVRAGRRFRVGDKVMQIRNNYDREVFNGDIGRIVDLDLEDQTVAVRFEDRTVPYDFSELDELVLAYAVTIHKSQGSEYPAVIIPIHTTHYVMLQRNLLYTAVTRGRRLVVLVGTRKAVAIAVKNAKTQERYSSLAARLRAHALSAT